MDKGRIRREILVRILGFSRKGFVVSIIYRFGYYIGYRRAYVDRRGLVCFFFGVGREGFLSLDFGVVKVGTLFYC